MKKFTLSFLVIITFGLYALFQRFGTISAPVIINDNSAINNATQPIADSTSTTQEQTVPSNSTTPIVEPSTNITVTNTPPVKQPSKVVTPTPQPVVKPKPTSGWTDGTFLGSNEDAYYGNVQVQAVISLGKLVDVVFLDYPQDNNRSMQKSAHATPILKSEAIASQSANVNTVSGVTYTSEAFKKSLAQALAQAKA